MIAKDEARPCSLVKRRRTARKSCPIPSLARPTSLATPRGAHPGPCSRDELQTALALMVGALRLHVARSGDASGQGHARLEPAVAGSNLAVASKLDALLAALPRRGDQGPVARPCAFARLVELLHEHHVDAGRGPFVFVGERRSPRAAQMKVVWDDGRLAAKSLFGALVEAGLDPARQVYLNLFVEPEEMPRDAGLDVYVVDPAALAQVAACEVVGAPVVGMGKRVQRELARYSIPHLALRHPAARGKLRRRDLYRALVAETLRPVLHPAT